ncbi:MAG: MmcQ/YjbR family DNA-binding protein [Rhizobiales bacterium]|nr:MmcQ/YjbR family DNA-binding protein [Hyphomicrobiales bacterium]
MSTAADFRRIALSLDGTSEAPHFDRRAFKVARIYATLAPDGRTANFKFAPDEQELKCLVAPEAFMPVPNAWGKQGWTTATLAKLTAPELRNALEMAWRHAVPKKRGDRAEDGLATMTGPIGRASPRPAPPPPGGGTNRRR